MSRSQNFRGRPENLATFQLQVGEKLKQIHLEEEKKIIHTFLQAYLHKKTQCHLHVKAPWQQKQMDADGSNQARWKWSKEVPPGERTVLDD